ncbi:MAG: ABC transporter ATP-binding protein [Comamonadaceae bacterium]|nr:ABC transporter ATP-binding protein [Comamonadaceae bacterium]
MIEFEQVRKAYGGRVVIDALSLRLKKGQITVLVGPSGCGKSTTLKMINRLEAHDAGTIRFAGQEIDRLPVEDLRRRMGYAIQSNGLFPHWTVAQNIATVPRLLRWDKARIHARVDELLDMLGMAPAQYRQRYPHQLSGGQQQRVGVARAMAADPEILLMDEPFGALDPVTRAAMQQELRRIHRLFGKTILLITHDIDEALTLADHLIVMQHGAIAQQGRPIELLRAPVSAFVRDFLGGDDIGLKSLTLQTVATRMRPEPAHANVPCIDQDASLRQAMAQFLGLGVAVLTVLSVKQPVGHLLFDDLLAPDAFAPPRAP